MIPDQILQASEPQAMYYASWNPLTPAQQIASAPSKEFEFFRNAFRCRYGFVVVHQTK